MSAKASSHAPTPRTPRTADDRSSGSHRVVRGRRNRAELEAGGIEEVSPPPLPSDPAIVAEIRAGIDRGLTQARARIGDDLDEVLAAMDRKIAAHS